MYLWIYNNFGLVVLLGIAAFTILNIMITKWEMKRFYHLCLLVAGGVYIVALFYVTLGMRTPGVDFHYELHLFWSYKRAFTLGERFYLWENFANVIAFLPLGMFLQEFFGKKIHWWGCMIMGAMISAGIEITQLITKRGLFEFDDIVHNTLGVTVGIFIAWVITQLVVLFNKSKN